MSPELEERSEVDDADAKPARDADDEPAPQPKSPQRRPGPLRYLFYLVWLLAVPAALAVGAVQALEPKPLEMGVGLVRTFVREQQVPATIMFFTLFAMILWRLRYVLPLSATAGVVARLDLPFRLRPKFDDATQLIGDARRIMDVRRRDVDRNLSKRERDNLTQALEQLDEVMRADTFAEARFTAALGKADQLVGEHLGRWRKGELREYAESIGVAVAVALILRFFVIEAFKIPSGSMIPTLMIGDHIFVAKYAYGPLLPHSDSRLWDDMPPHRGDVMVFKFPENKEQDFIKRVVAVPGDTLETLDGRLVLNGWLAPNCEVGAMTLPGAGTGHLYVEYLEDRAYLTLFDSQLRQEACSQDRDCGGVKVCRGNVCGMPQGPFRVAPGEVWVMGDNRNNSHDSRYWKGGLGAGVPLQNIKGRAMFVWWSWDPRGGVALDRIFVNVMGPPRLPPGVGEGLKQSLERCLQSPPPLDRTTPPGPRP